MEDHVSPCHARKLIIKLTKLNAIDLKAVGISDDMTEQEREKLWGDIDNGVYRLVYVPPEILLDKTNHFWKTTLKTGNEFMKNLVLVAIDEAHLVWDWEHFRKGYTF